MPNTWVVPQARMKIANAQNHQPNDTSLCLVTNSASTKGIEKYEIAMMVSETTCSQISSGRHNRQMPCGARLVLSNKDCTASSMDHPLVSVRSGVPSVRRLPHHACIDTM